MEIKFDSLDENEITTLWLKMSKIEALKFVQKLYYEYYNSNQEFVEVGLQTPLNNIFIEEKE